MSKTLTDGVVLAGPGFLSYETQSAEVQTIGWCLVFLNPSIPVDSLLKMAVMLHLNHSKLFGQHGPDVSQFRNFTVV